MADLNWRCSSTHVSFSPPYTAIYITYILWTCWNFITLSKCIVSFRTAHFGMSNIVSSCFNWIYFPNSWYCFYPIYYNKYNNVSYCSYVSPGSETESRLCRSVLSSVQNLELICLPKFVLKGNRTWNTLTSHQRCRIRSQECENH